MHQFAKTLGSVVRLVIANSSAPSTVLRRGQDNFGRRFPIPRKYAVWGMCLPVVGVTVGSVGVRTNVDCARG
jgi:hypothetical protein